MTLRQNLKQVFHLMTVWKKGLPLQNKLWDVLVRSRFQQVILDYDIEKVIFLQIHIRESGRACLSV